MQWFVIKDSIQKSVRSAMHLSGLYNIPSIAFPIIGGGTGACAQEAALAAMLEAFASLESNAQVVIVRFAG